jgi:hypothetical protein
MRVFKKVHWSLSIGHWSLLIGTGGGDAALTRRRDAYATSKTPPRSQRNPTGDRRGSRGRQKPDANWHELTRIFDSRKGREGRKGGNKLNR